MIEIALCDSSPVSQRLIACMLEKLRSIKDFTLTKIKTGPDLLEKLKRSEPDIILINENFCITEGADGTGTARYIRQNSSVPEIIYLTSAPAGYSAFSASEAHDYTCVMKPVLYNDIEKSVLSSIKNIPESNDITFRCDRTYITVPSDEIIYLEADKRNTHIRTSEKSYISTENITSILERLPENTFFRTHRTYALNLTKISSTDDDTITMSNGEQVILSRQRKKDFQTILQKYK